SDMCVALAALDAKIRVRNSAAERIIPIGEFHRLPETEPQRDTNLNADELILSIDLPPSSYAEHYDYLKVLDRATYAFALVSVAAALDLDRGGRIRSARLALGGVAHKPWRCPEAEALLVGKSVSPTLFEQAGKAAVADAKPYRDNRFKVTLTQR